MTQSDICLVTRYGHPSDPSRRIDVTERVSEFLRGPGVLGAGWLRRFGCGIHSQGCSVAGCWSINFAPAVPLLAMTSFLASVQSLPNWFLKLRLGNLVREGCYSCLV